MAGRYRRNGEVETLGCLVQILLLIFAMPLVGLYLLVPPNSSTKAWNPIDRFRLCSLDHFPRNVKALK